MNKGKKLSATFIEWYVFTNLLQKLQKDNNFRMALLIGIPGYLGLRIGDCLKLKWSDILNKTDLIIQEGKTRKMRELRVNRNLQELILQAYTSLKVDDTDELIFINRYKTKAISLQFVNRILKKTALKYKLTNDPSQWKSHMLRKTFGRHVYESNNKNDMGLIILSQLFNHSSVATTRLYLGLKKEELDNIYENL